MGSRNGATGSGSYTVHARTGFAAKKRPWAPVGAWLKKTRATDEDDRRRELVLNWILLALVALALEEAGQRVPAVITGGADVADHARTMIVSFVAAITFAGLLVISRHGRQVVAAWGLMLAYYTLITWLFITEGTEEPVAIVLCTTMVVTGGVLLGTWASASAALLLTATMIPVAALQSAKVLRLPVGHDTPNVFSLVALGGGLAVLALVLSARTAERRAPLGELLGGTPPAIDSAISVLTVRELQIARLVAAGRSNAEIAQELFLSLRTVHTHVSNALRKTGCTNRTELAVLAIRAGALPHEEPVGAPS